MDEVGLLTELKTWNVLRNRVYIINKYIISLI